MLHAPWIDQIRSHVRLACEWEALARKAGNVCPGREFADLRVEDFLRSADAIAPVIARSAEQTMGCTIRRAIEATRGVVNTNTNLGIVLLLAPLAAVRPGDSLSAGIGRVLEATTREDAAEVYQAIRIANPGGLGEVPDQDVRSTPTQSLQTVMTLARERDLIAAQYADHFALVLAEMLPEFRERFRELGSIEQAVVELQLMTLVRYPDSLIVRKLGLDVANEIRRRASAVTEQGGTLTPRGRHAYCEFDDWLRADGHRRNPGTTADLVAATLFAALREGIVDASANFVWAAHPFGGDFE